MLKWIRDIMGGSIINLPQDFPEKPKFDTSNCYSEREIASACLTFMRKAENYEKEVVIYYRDKIGAEFVKKNIIPILACKKSPGYKKDSEFTKWRRKFEGTNLAKKKFINQIPSHDGIAAINDEGAQTKTKSNQEESEDETFANQMKQFVSNETNQTGNPDDKLPRIVPDEDLEKLTSPASLTNDNRKSRQKTRNKASIRELRRQRLKLSRS